MSGMSGLIKEAHEAITKVNATIENVKETATEINADNENAEATEKDFWQADPRGFMDRVIAKASSRKLLVFTICTIGLFIGKLTDDTWSAIALGYIGSVTVEKIAALFAASRK